MNHLQSEQNIESLAPIDMLEHLFASRSWEYERNGDEEIITVVKGSWEDYELRALWREEDRVLQFIALIGINASAGHGDTEARTNLFETLTLINEQLWLGHFELWSADGTILFRHATPLDSAEDTSLSLAHACTLVDTALDECERYFPVFQFVLWGGKRPREALVAAMIEIEGEA